MWAEGALEEAAKAVNASTEALDLVRAALAIAFNTRPYHIRLSLTAGR